MNIRIEREACTVIPYHYTQTGFSPTGKTDIPATSKKKPTSETTKAALPKTVSSETSKQDAESKDMRRGGKNQTKAYRS